MSKRPTRKQSRRKKDKQPSRIRTGLELAAEVMHLMTGDPIHECKKNVAAIVREQGPPPGPAVMTEADYRRRLQGVRAHLAADPLQSAPPRVAEKIMARAEEEAASGKCCLCGGKPRAVVVWAPSRPCLDRMMVPADRAEAVVYAACEACSSEPGWTTRVEEMLLAEFDAMAASPLRN